jgi:hypothetical protein
MKGYSGGVANYLCPVLSLLQPRQAGTICYENGESYFVVAFNFGSKGMPDRVKRLTAPAGAPRKCSRMYVVHTGPTDAITKKARVACATP